MSGATLEYVTLEKPQQRFKRRPYNAPSTKWEVGYNTTTLPPLETDFADFDLAVSAAEFALKELHSQFLANTSFEPQNLFQRLTIPLVFTSGSVTDELLESVRSVGKAFQRHNVQLHILARLAFLRLMASEEGIAFGEKSLSYLNSFLPTLGDFKTPAIFLLDSGNLRAVWREVREQVALEFMADGVVRYVLFAERPKPITVARSAGIDDKVHIIEQIKTMGLWNLISET